VHVVYAGTRSICVAGIATDGCLAMLCAPVVVQVLCMGRHLSCSVSWQ
jgi:hypothetical protein